MSNYPETATPGNQTSREIRTPIENISSSNVRPTAELTALFLQKENAALAQAAHEAAQSVGRARRILTRLANIVFPAQSETFKQPRSPEYQDLLGIASLTPQIHEAFLRQSRHITHQGEVKIERVGPIHLQPNTDPNTHDKSYALGLYEFGFDADGVDAINKLENFGTQGIIQVGEFDKWLNNEGNNHEDNRLIETTFIVGKSDNGDWKIIGSLKELKFKYRNTLSREDHRNFSQYIKENQEGTQINQLAVVYVEVPLVQIRK